jgi:hypothetical protein
MKVTTALRLWVAARRRPVMLIGLVAAVVIAWWVAFVQILAAL